MSKWVLLLGGSTGHGAATAKKLASEGYGIIAFHFDRGEAKKIANDTIQEVKNISKDRCHYFNTNAASENLAGGLVYFCLFSKSLRFNS